MTHIRCTLVLLLSAVPAFTWADSSQTPFTKSWTHVNGNTAVLELLEYDGENVKFLKSNGKTWTMPVDQLVASDRAIAIEMNQNRNAQTEYRVSVVRQDTDLEKVRSDFATIKTANPTLYQRLNAIAELPMDEYEIGVNDEGTYYLQFMLKEGVAVDRQIEGLVSQYLNSASESGNVPFKLTQIATDVLDEGELTSALESTGELVSPSQASHSDRDQAPPATGELSSTLEAPRPTIFGFETVGFVGQDVNAGEGHCQVIDAPPCQVECSPCCAQTPYCVVEENVTCVRPRRGLVRRGRLAGWLRNFYCR